MTTTLAPIDRLCDLHCRLETVDGALDTILSVSGPDSLDPPSPKELLNMVQLLAYAVTPACEELKAIMPELETKPASPTLPQGRKARVKQKGR